MQGWDSHRHMIKPSLCVLCRRDLSACIRAQCPFCPTTTCVSCSHEHSQAHYTPNWNQLSSPDARPYQPASHPLSPPLSLPSYTPTASTMSFPPPPPPFQRPSFHRDVPYFPPPPNTFPGGQQYHHPRDERNVFPGPPTPPFHQPAASARGHRNWIAWSIDKGTAVVKHPITKKCMKTGAKVALVGVSLGVGADLTGLADMSSGSGFFFGDGDGGSGTVGDGSSPDVTGSNMTAPNVEAPNMTAPNTTTPISSQEMQLMNSAANWQPLLSCSSLSIG